MGDGLPDAWAQARASTQHHSVFGLATPPRGAGAAASASAAEPTHTSINHGQLAMPTFIPGETNVESYARSVQFLFSLWPAQAWESFVTALILKVEGTAM